MVINNPLSDVRATGNSYVPVSLASVIRVLTPVYIPGEGVQAAADR